MGDVPQSQTQTQSTHLEGKPKSALPASAGNGGTQSIARAFQLFRIVANAGEKGLRLSDAATALDLKPSTAHRILTALVNEHVIARDPVHRRYRIGTDFLRLMEGLSRIDFGQRYGEATRLVSEEIGESCYFSVPDGMEVVCISRSLGTSPIQPVPFDVGGRRPFGVGVAGIIALAAMPQSRIDSILFQHAQTYENYGIKTGDIARLVHECREIGYSYNPGLFIKGVSGLGIPIIGVKGQLIGALHIVALDEQLRSKTKRLEVINLLRRAVKRVNSLD